MAGFQDREALVGPAQYRGRTSAMTIDIAAESGPQCTQQQPQSVQSSNSPITPQEDSSGPFTQPGPCPERDVKASLDGKGSLPPSPPNVLIPTRSISNDCGPDFPEAPGGARDRQNPSNAEVDARIVRQQGDTVIATSSTQPDYGKMGKSRSENIMDDDNALDPDAGTEELFHVDNNPFAFSPGQLSKMFDPKSLAAFYKLGGLDGLEKGLRTDRQSGLSLDEGPLSGAITFDEATLRDGRTAGNASKADTSIREAGQRFQDRLRVFKDNRIPARKGNGLLKLMFIAMKDKVLILLSIAAVISLTVGLYQTFAGSHNEDDEPKIEWVEGVAIVVAIVTVVLTSSLVDWRKERRFAKLNRKKQDRNVKVVRSGKSAEISVYDILVGDVLHLEPGDMVPADGILIHGFNIQCDESQATGESDVVRKQPADNVFRAIENHDDSLSKLDPFIQSGSRVTEGIGTCLVTSTGINSTYGKILIALNEEQDMTPLQSKLNVIAIWIAKLGSAAALLLFTILFIKFLVSLRRIPDRTPAEEGQKFLEILIVVVTIIVVAVPEGLPLAVTLALAYAMVRMLKDNNLVRHLKACEVMGNATCICSDKTGTLTQNEMRVVSGTVGASHRFGAVPTESQGTVSQGTLVAENSSKSAQQCVSELSPSVRDLLLKSIALNSTAFQCEENGQVKFTGSKTETALLFFARDNLGMGPVGVEREKAHTLQLLPFDSGRKSMGIVVSLPHGRARLYVKGASELILAKCKDIMQDPAADTAVTPMTPEAMATISELIDSYAMRSLRTIGIAYRDFESWPPEAWRPEDNPNGVDIESLFDHLSFIAMVGIQDPLRQGVSEAVAACQKAGVTVRMVTGDNKLTAETIARECGTLKPGGIVIEGPEFRKLSRLQQEELIPQLQVLARTSPDDKRILVKRLKEKDEIVAVTGDGTNDAPALTTSDVGFSMGQSGTEVAREASAIILMDDNFISIVQALKWGRAVNDSVKRFLQFQLTVNITAVALTFITAVSSDEEVSVLTAVQLLWVNLIMDTLAALALATDPPQDSILNRKPEPRKNFIITITMWKMILGQAVYQLVVTLVIYYQAPKGILPLPQRPNRDEISTLVFNTFVWMQIFKMWNARRLDNKFNIFEGIFKNPYFICINVCLCGAQVLIIFLGGVAFSINDGGQSPGMWAIAVVLGLLSIPIGVLIRLIPDWTVALMFSAFSSLVPKRLKRRRRKLSCLKVSDEEMGIYPEPLVEVRDELKILRRMKGGRLNSLKFKVQHPKEAVMHRPPTPSKPKSLRSEPLQPPRTSTNSDILESGTAPPDLRRPPKSVRSRSNSVLGAPTVMAGIVAAGVVARWSPGGTNGDRRRGGR